jgi:hypothetical protein
LPILAVDKQETDERFRNLHDAVRALHGKVFSGTHHDAGASDIHASVLATTTASRRERWRK